MDPHTGQGMDIPRIPPWPDFGEGAKSKRFLALTCIAIAI